MIPSKILVFSEDARGRVFVGELKRTADGYSFLYDHDYMSRSSATELGPDIPLSLNEIRSKKFFESLYDLIPSRENPAYKDYCHSVGISPDEKDPMALLAKLGKGPSNFVFEVAPCDELLSGEQLIEFRRNLGLSQRQFANFFDIPIATLQTIEKETSDARTTRRYLQIFIEHPAALWKILEKRGLYIHSRQKEVMEKFVENAVNKIATDHRQLGYLEASHWLPNNQKRWDQNQLLEAAERAKCCNTGWPIGVVLHTEHGRPVFMSDGIKVEAESMFGSYDEWSLKRDGGFYFFRIFEEDESTSPNKSDVLYFDTRIWRIAELIGHCINLYKAMGVSQDELIEIQIIHSGLKSRELSTSNPLRASLHPKGKCVEDIVTWGARTTLADLNNKKIDYIVSAVKELCILFGGWLPDPKIITSIYNEFLRSKI